ncbi:MAG: hypothetical protein ABII90_02985 [Bacteroidota bacterium]
MKLNLEEYEVIMNKLKSDGFIKYYKKELGQEEDVKLTFEGKLFIESGGYAGKIKKENSKNRLRQVTTIAVATGTTLGGLWGLIQILKEILPWLCRFCSFP